MGSFSNQRRAGTGALVLASVLWGSGVVASAQESMSTNKAATPFGAAEKAMVDGVPMTFYAEVWDGLNGTPSTTVVRVVAGGEKFPRGITLEKMWYANGGRREEASVLPEVVPAPDNEQIRWASGVADSDDDGEVDLLLQLRDSRGKRYLLRSEALPVRGMP